MVRTVLEVPVDRGVGPISIKVGDGDRRVSPCAGSGFSGKPPSPLYWETVSA